MYIYFLPENFFHYFVLIIAKFNFNLLHFKHSCWHMCKAIYNLNDNIYSVEIFVTFIQNIETICHPPNR